MKVKNYLILLICLCCSAVFECHAFHRLENKVAIVTGGSKGIGKAISKLFADEGAQVIVVSRTEAELREIVMEILNNGGSASYFVADITQPEEMKKMAEYAIAKHGRIDILAHNAAGIYPPARIESMTNEEWLEAINTNLNGTFYAVKAVIPTMKKQQYGRIVFTSSISGPQVGLPTKSHYTASKGGMNGFMKTIAIELAKDHITVNAVEPGNIMTEGLKVNSPEAGLFD